MILSGQTIRRLNILEPCAERTQERGLSYGLGPAGYDLRLVLGSEPDPMIKKAYAHPDGRYCMLNPGEFTLAAGVERFTMPNDVLGIVHDKSSLARLGLSVFNTVIEPGWEGWLTLELSNKGPKPIRLVEGQAIAQVVFHRLDEPTERSYDGKYHNQAYGPQVARG
jgi:dCTP deaminase